MSGKLKEVRERMKSVQSTQQITSAMKMVSAAKLRKAQDSIVRLRPYANKFDKILQHLLDSLEGAVDTPFADQREVKNAVVVVMTSDRGLCGAFNTNIIKQAVALIDEKYSVVRSSGNLTIMCIGKRGFDYFRKSVTPIAISISEHVGLFQGLKYLEVEKVVNGLLDKFIESRI